MTGKVSISAIPKLLASPEVTERFAEHVKETCVRPFPPLYFAVGIVEEVAELAHELNHEGTELALVSELGDVLWYIFALCQSLLFPPLALDDATKSFEPVTLVSATSFQGSARSVKRG